MRIAVDAMGGDHAPEPVVHGALAAAGQIRGGIILVGQEDAVRGCLTGTLPANVRIHHASQVVDMHETPTEALRQKKDSSISVCAALVRSGEAEAMVSAGNTGAATAASLLAWRQIAGIHRPAIAQVFPNRSGRFLLLDAGASPDVDPKHLVEFGIMGRAYAEKVMGRSNPTVKLLNIGEEPGKGNAFAKSAHQLLSEFSWFGGNVEGKDLFRQDLDVVVCDAFVGNILLKVCEGLGEFLIDEIRAGVPGWPMRALYLPLKSAMRPLLKKVDYAEYGGSPLLGLNGICVISHGRSNARAMENAILNAARAVDSDLVATIRDRVGTQMEREESG